MKLNRPIKISNLPSKSEGRRLIVTLVVVLFLSTVAIPQIMGSGTRFQLIIEAILFAVALSCLGLAVIIQGRVRIDQTYSLLIVLFVIFLVLAVVATINGILHGYSLSYVVGDFFKFTVAIGTVFLLYLTADSQTLESSLTYIYHVLVVVMIFVLGLYVSGYLLPNQRPTLIAQLPSLLVMALWLRSRGNSASRFTFPLLIIMTIPLVYYVQSLSLILNIVGLMSLTLIYYYLDGGNLLRRVAIFATMGGVGLAVVLAIGSHIPSEQWQQYGYLGKKIGYMFGDYTLYERLLLLGGSRVAEPIGILSAINNDMTTLLFGSGMGSKFVATSPFGDPVWAERDHFVHSGLWESVLRTGLVGGAIYLSLLFINFYVGLRIRQDSYLGAWVAANATMTLVFAPIGGKFLGPGFFNYFLFSYGLVRWTELRSEGDRSKSNQTRVISKD